MSKIDAKLNILLIGAFDSSFKWGSALYTGIGRNRTHFTIFIDQQKANQLTEKQVKSTYVVDHILSGSAKDYISSSMIFAYDAVILVLDGRTTKILTDAFSKNTFKTRTSRPLIIAAYAGVVLENQVGGFLLRAGADYVLANSNLDIDTYHKILEVLKLPKSKAQLTGLPFISSETQRSNALAAPKSVLFAGQPNVPFTKNERARLLENLLAYADAHPDRKITLKPRHKAKQVSFNSENYPYDLLLKEASQNRPLPDNFQICHLSIEKQIKTHDLILTISSTAALEAYYAGKNISILAGYGYSQRSGWNFFMGSGRMITYDRFICDDFSDYKADWIRDYLQPNSDCSHMIFDLIVSFKSIQAKRNSPTQLADINSIDTALNHMDEDMAEPKSSRINIDDYNTFGGLPSNRFKRSSIILSANALRALKKVPLLKRFLVLLKVAFLLEQKKSEKANQVKYFG